MENYVIEISNYKKVIKGNTILNDINLNLEKGKCYGFIGRNGSGKSMLFKAICGLIKATEGKISVNSKVIGKDVDFPENVGSLIEYPGFLENLSGYKNLKYLAEIQNKISDDRIKEVIELVDLDYNDKRPVKKYSLGMKQRLGIAQAIMENPNIIILDEPMNGLDKSGVKIVRELISSLKTKENIILIASHNSDDIDILCDEVFEMDRGEIEKIK